MYRKEYTKLYIMNAIIKECVNTVSLRVCLQYCQSCKSLDFPSLVCLHILMLSTGNSLISMSVHAQCKHLLISRQKQRWRIIKQSFIFATKCFIFVTKWLNWCDWQYWRNKCKLIELTFSSARYNLNLWVWNSEKSLVNTGVDAKWMKNNLAKDPNMMTIINTMTCALQVQIKFKWKYTIKFYIMWRFAKENNSSIQWFFIC